MIKVRKLGTKKWISYDVANEIAAIELLAYENELEPCIIETSSGYRFQLESAVEYNVISIHPA